LLSPEWKTSGNAVIERERAGVEWEIAVESMRSAGFEPVPAFNPYWDRNGITFEDPDGYRTVLQNAGWVR
jgi:hypothetical protein